MYILSNSDIMVQHCDPVKFVKGICNSGDVSFCGVSDD